MILEATQPLEINIDGSVYELDPGQCFNLPDGKADRARPFIEEGILREVHPSNLKIMPRLKGLTEGCLIEWKSPPFGLLTGRVLMVPGDGSILVDHPLNDGRFGPASTPEDWITRIIER